MRSPCRASSVECRVLCRNTPPRTPHVPHGDRLLLQSTVSQYSAGSRAPWTCAPSVCCSCRAVRMRTDTLRQRPRTSWQYWRTAPRTSSSPQPRPLRPTSSRTHNVPMKCRRGSSGRGAPPECRTHRARVRRPAASTPDELTRRTPVTSRTAVMTPATSRTTMTQTPMTRVQTISTRSITLILNELLQKRTMRPPPRATSRTSSTTPDSAVRSSRWRRQQLLSLLRCTRHSPRTVQPLLLSTCMKHIIIYL